MSELPVLYAVISRDGSGVALGAPQHGKARPIASYELVRADGAAGEVAVYAAGGATLVSEPTFDGCEVVEIDNRCLARLLADSVRQLAASTGPSGEIEELPFEAPPNQTRSAGIILVDELGRLTIREPANHYAGYEHSYAKGRLDAGETPQQAALRELTEETGLVGRIVGLVGDFPGQTGVTRFYVGVRTGGRETPSDETWAVKTVTPLSALALLNVQRDKQVLYRLVEVAASHTDWTWTIAGRPTRCRMQAGRIHAGPAG